jgi:hypothetical protein
VTFVFVVAASVSIAFHEPWRDELQAWLIARDATGPLSLLHDIRYEGHPGLWYLGLFPLTRLGGPGLMSALNLIFAAGAVFLFSRFAPFGRATRVLFAFGYLPLYEWGTIARNYAIGVFFLFLFAVLFPSRERRPLLVGAVLALAANTSLHAAIVVVGALALLAAEQLAPRAERGSTAASWAGIGLGAAGVLVSALQISPPADSAVGAIWASRTIGERLGIAISSLVHGFAPVPWPKPLEQAGLGWLHVLQIVAGVAFTAVFIVTAGLTLARRRMAWIAAAVPVSALLLIFYARYYGGARHAGFMLVATVIALWVAPSFAERPLGVGRLARSSAEAERFLAPIFTATLTFHLVGAAIATGVDVRYVFSAAPSTAALIREKGLADLPMVADPDWAASNVVAQLGKPRAYYANVDRWGSFMVQDDRHGRGGGYTRAPSDEFVFARAASLARGTDVVVLLNREARAETLTRAGAALVGYRLSDVFQDESFWVYLVPAGKQETAAALRAAPDGDKKKALKR